jgi:hypothetical protein
MEIVKEAGEQPPPRLHHRLVAELRPLLAVRGAGAALVAGSGILLRHGWAYLGERLHGWERYGACAFGGYVAVYGCGHAPHIARFAVPGAVVAWCVAAWWVAPPAAVEESEHEAGEEAVPELTLTELADLVRRVAEHRQGAHLADLLGEPELVGWTQSELKATAADFGLPVEEFKIIFAGGQRVRDGVRLRHLPPDPAPAPSAEAPPDPAPDPSPQPIPAPSQESG